MTTKPPDLRKVRLLLIRTLDMLPSDGPDWHPTFQAANRVREHVKEAKRAAEEYLGPGE
jgi:hypothetical protein